MTFSSKAINETSYCYVDRLDQGYTPDGMGVALVDGLVPSSVN